jgi:hypothetical protein
MTHARKLWVLIAIGAIAYASVPEARAAAMGSIRGSVKDAEGKPLAGAAVVVLADAETAKEDKIVKRASTDKDGKFIASGITPGRYRVKAEADGFSPVELAASVVANKATIFDSIRLRQVSLLSEQTRLDPNPKYSARRARGSVLHFEEDPKTPPAASEGSTVALSDRSPEVHGVVHAFSQSTPGSRDASGSFVGANFAVSQNIGQDIDLVVGGQVGVGDGAPQRLEAVTTYSGDRHRISLALGYGRFTFSRHGSVPRLGQFSLSATDTWQISGPVLVVYGLEFARFTEGETGTSVLPRFGFAVDARARTRVFAGMEPGSSVDQQSQVELESGEIVLSEPKSVALAPNGEPIQERSYRLQMGAQQVLSDKSSLEMMAFFDTVSGHGVGLLAIPVERSGSDPILRNEEQKGRSRGVRLVYHRRLNDVLEGAIGYAFGEGQRLDSRGISEPASLFGKGLFHVVSAKIDANFVNTGTRVSTVLRLAPDQAVFAIDPFQGQISTYDPNISVSFAQVLPTSGLVPGHWEAVIDLRNLLDQQASVSDERQELIASRFHRLVRVGLSLRF